MILSSEQLNDLLQEGDMPVDVPMLQIERVTDGTSTTLKYTFGTDEPVSDEVSFVGQLTDQQEHVVLYRYIKSHHGLN